MRIESVRNQYNATGFGAKVKILGVKRGLPETLLENTVKKASEIGTEKDKILFYVGEKYKTNMTVINLLNKKVSKKAVVSRPIFAIATINNKNYDINLGYSYKHKGFNEEKHFTKNFNKYLKYLSFLSK